VSKIRVCFLGTPEFAVTCLKSILSDEHYDVVGVVTQPDRPSGRKLQLTPSAVKAFATAKGLRVISPESIKNKLILEEIQRWGAELAVVVAYGQILPQSFLDMFPIGAVNVHASLLPRWRGAAPIQRSIEAGDKVTGVALQKVVKELDAGDVIGSREVTIEPDMDAQVLHDKLAQLGADTLVVELMDFARGNLAPKPQDVKFVTYAKKLDKSEALIDWNQSAQKIHDKVRAFVMGPGTYTQFQGKRLKIHKTRVVNSDAKKGLHAPGDFLDWNEDRLVVATSDGAIEILEVQPESRNRLSIKDFLKSATLSAGEKFGS
jgi:methionyl-tRNA formyltransferase